jgi:hypothetical protein
VTPRHNAPFSIRGSFPVSGTPGVGLGLMAALRWGSPLTIADLEGMPDDGHRYELIDGTVLVTPAPNTVHQQAVARL